MQSLKRYLGYKEFIAEEANTKVTATKEAPIRYLKVA